MRHGLCFFVILWLLVTPAFGESAHPHVDLEVTEAPLFKLDGQQLAGPAAVDKKLAELATRTPKPIIYVRGNPTISPKDLLERMADIMGPLRETAEKNGIKIYLIGHEASP